MRYLFGRGSACDYWPAWRDTRRSFLDVCKELVEHMHAHYQQGSRLCFLVARASHQSMAALEVPIITTMIREIRFFRFDSRHLQDSPPIHSILFARFLMMGQSQPPIYPVQERTARRRPCAAGRAEDYMLLPSESCRGSRTWAGQSKLVPKHAN